MVTVRVGAAARGTAVLLLLRLGLCPGKVAPVSMAMPRQGGLCRGSEVRGVSLHHPIPEPWFELWVRAGARPRATSKT